VVAKCKLGLEIPQAFGFTIAGCEVHHSVMVGVAPHLLENLAKFIVNPAVFRINRRRRPTSRRP